MSTSEIRNQLESIGIGISSRDSTVLKTILLLKEDNVPTTFSEIMKHLDKTLEKKLGKQWIYKCLAHLDEEGFIQVDRISSPKKYLTDTNRIKGVLERKITETRKRLASERKHMRDNIETLEKQDMKVVAEYMLSLVRGSDLLASSEILEGNAVIRNAIVEISSGASENDLFRISEKIKMQDVKDVRSDSVESTIVLATQKGAKVRALVEFSKASKKDVKKDVANAFEAIIEMTIDAIQKGDVVIRTPTGSLFPYKMIALNNEAMVISLVGEGITQEHGILVRSGENPGLFQDIIEKFDRIWDQALDVKDQLFDFPR